MKAVVRKTTTNWEEQDCNPTQFTVRPFRTSNSKEPGKENRGIGDLEKKWDGLDHSTPRRVLESYGDLLSLGLYWKSPVTTGVKTCIK